MFQSSPAPKDGRYHNAFPHTVSHVIVSILARPEGRALPARSSQFSVTVIVSILARPEGRALLRTTASISIFRISFNPRPPRRTGATSAGAISTATTTFQSSPAPKDGRYIDAVVRIVRREGVSILARPEGRALRPRSASSQPTHAVSILARPEGRALPHYLTKA